MLNQKILSPISGSIIPIENIQDRVFSEKMLGDGIAVRPHLDEQVVVAPCDGVIQTLQDTSHAVVLVTPEGTEILIHIGIDTVTLKGKGFKALTSVGKVVKAGDVLIEVDFAGIISKVPSIDVILAFTNLKEGNTLVKTNASTIKVGEEIATIVNKEKESPTKGWFGRLFSTKKATVQNNKTLVGDTEIKEVESKEIKEKRAKLDKLLEVPIDDEVVSDLLTIMNVTGIHARPASMIFQIASKYRSKIQLKKDDKVVNAKSVIAILSLGLKYEDKLQVIATGEDADIAIGEISKVIIDGLGEDISHIKSEVEKVVVNENMGLDEAIVDYSQPFELKGVMASPGLVIGKSILLQEEEISVTEISDNPQEEAISLVQALAEAKNTLVKDIEQAVLNKQGTKVEVFTAHLDMLQDPSLMEDSNIVIYKGKTCAFAWKQAIRNACKKLIATNNNFLIERIADLKDLEKRVLKIILNLPEENTSFEKDTIIIAKDLLPSDLVKFDENVIGVVLSSGSATSHVSLMLRNMGIPTLVAVGSGILGINNGSIVVLDADANKLLSNIEDKEMQNIMARQSQLNLAKAENIKHAKAVAKTKDNYEISVKGNVSNTQQVHEAYDLGAEGIGLLRTEFLFFNSLKAPQEAEQHVLYQGALDTMQGGQVTLRTLDVGGDKPLAYVQIGREENPIMGLRGVRNYVNNMDIFLTQIRAILKVKPLILCKIMLPMVAEISEFIEMRTIIEKEKEKLGIVDKIAIGTMIEVPSSAILADKFSKYVDFFSIGTNDLAQYTLAMDRGNSNLTSRLKNLNPAILKLIKMTVEGGNKYNKPTAVCGAMASEIKAIPILVGLGIAELSASMRSIPDVKALIRTLDYKKCVDIATKALELESPEEVESLVSQEFGL